METQRQLMCAQMPSGEQVSDLAVLEADGGPLVVCADSSNDAWTWDPLRDLWRRRPLARAYEEEPDAPNDVVWVSAGRHDGRVVLAGGGEHEGLALWDLDSGELIKGACVDDPIWSIAATEVEGRLTFVTGGASFPALDVWGPSRQDEPEQLVNDHHDGIAALATAHLCGRPLVAAGGFDALVSVWDLARGEHLASFRAQDGVARAVALTRVGDRAAVVAGADPGEVYLWELADGGAQLAGPLTGHEDRIFALDVATPHGRSLAVTGSEDETVRIWDLAAGHQLGAPLTGHRGSVDSVVTTTLRGHPVAITGGQDGHVRVWDLTAA